MSLSTRDLSKPSGECGLPVSRGQAYASFAIVGLAILMGSIDSSIVAVSVPTMLVDLRTNLAWIGWTITGYQFAISVVAPIAGKLSDDFGRKWVFLGSVVLFTGSSMAVGLAPNVYWLIFFRIVQGVGAGAFLPSATGVVCDVFGNRRASAIGLFSSIWNVGGILGPNIGGLVLSHLSWRWVFFVNVPISLLLLLAGMIMLPRIQSPSAGRHIDLVGAGLFSGALVAVLCGMTNWADAGTIGPVTTAFFVLGLSLAVVFVKYEKRQQHPMLDLGLFKERSLLAVNAYNFLMGVVVFGVSAFIPLYATLAYGMTPGESGLLLTPRSVATIIVSAATALFLIRLGYRIPLVVGGLGMATSLFLLSRGYHEVNLLGFDIGNIVLLALVLAIFGVGVGISNPASSNALIDLMPEKAAAITGVRTMFRQTGGVFGTTAVVLVISRFQDKAQGFETMYLWFALIMVAMTPIVLLIPDTARKRRKRALSEGG